MPRGRQTKSPVTLDDDARTTLGAWLRSPKVTSRLAKRVQAILLLGEHMPYAETARRVGLTERHVRRWAARYREEGLSGLLAKRGERMPRLSRRPLR
jgi:hypothetical protein